MKYFDYFEIGKRIGNEETYVFLKDDAPRDLRELAYTIHKERFYDALPNDWIFRVMIQAFEELAREEIEDILVEAVFWNCDIARWFYENCNNYASEYVDEYMNNYPAKEIHEVMHYIRMGQWLAKQTIYYAVNDFLVEQREKGESEDDCDS